MRRKERVTVREFLREGEGERIQGKRVTVSVQ